jgi:hypothetical protein
MKQHRLLRSSRGASAPKPMFPGMLIPREGGSEAAAAKAAWKKLYAVVTAKFPDAKTVPVAVPGGDSRGRGGGSHSAPDVRIPGTRDRAAEEPEIAGSA